MKFSPIFIFLFLLVLTPFILAKFGFDDENLPKVTRDPPVVITFNNNTGAVNSSDFWDGLDTINTTQMENNGGVLNILESWLTTFWNSVFATKTTDDLTEGSTNLYDNKSWNQSLIVGNINVTGDIFSNSFQVISYQRTVNIKNVTMTAVI